MAEVWKPVVGYEGQYEVSDQGRVRNRRGWILKPTRTFGGYEMFCFCGGRPRKAVRTHQLVCRAFHGPAPSPKHEVCHNDGNNRHNAADNLRWDTHAANYAEALRHNGKEALNAKLTSKQVIEIRAQLAKGVRQSALARRFGVTSTAINSIARGRTWTRVAQPAPE